VLVSARRLLCSLSTMVVVGLLGSPAALAAAPEVSETYSTEVSATSATLHAEINPQGSETYYQFEIAPAGGAFAPIAEAGGSGSLPEGSAGVPVEVHVQHGLAANTAYEFRVIVGNAAQSGVDGEAASFLTEHAGGELAPSGLPDGRRWEMVTPPEKQGALIQPISKFLEGKLSSTAGSPVQAAASGDAIVDQASQPTEVEAPGNGGNQTVSVLSTRGVSGWSSQVIEPPHAEATGSAGGNPYKLFSEDLAAGVLVPDGPFDPLLSPEASESTPFVRADYLNGEVEEHCQGSCYTPLVTRADDTASPFEPFGEANANGECDGGICGPGFRAATPDLSHVLISSQAPLTADSLGTLYEWSGGRLQSLPFELAGGGYEDENVSARRALSDNGNRVVLESGENLYLYEVPSGRALQLDLAESGCGACESGGVNGATIRIDKEGVADPFFGYMTASSDGARVFFLDDRKLTAVSPSGSWDLYEYDVEKPEGHRLTDLTVDPHAGEPAEVETVLGSSEDGSYVYFIAGGRLTPEAHNGSVYCESGETCNLYVSHEGATRLIAELGPKDKYFWAVNLASGLQTQRARVSPDGRWLAFMSYEPLTGYDNRDAVSGGRDAEVYLYEAEAGRLTCASCDPTGARPTGVGGVASYVPGSDGGNFVQYAGEKYQPRYLSDSGRVFFDSLDALVPGDTDGVGDVYEYEPEGVPTGGRACSRASTSATDVFEPARSVQMQGATVRSGAGCVALISAGTSSDESTFLDASESGGDVFFLTTSKLAPQDSDDAYDVYDAHECTAASPCVASVTAPPPCSTEASCRPSPTPQPSLYGAPPSATFSGPGNVAPAAGQESNPVKRVTAKTTKCRRGLVKNRRGECVPKKKQKQKRGKKSNANRRTSR
jgi:hypothetical protein